MSDKVRIQSDKFHVIIAPKELVDADLFINYLKKIDAKYIVSLEYGAGGHPHIDSYVILKSKIRSDNFKRNIVKLYPNIPKNELKNVKVVINQIDKDDRYAIGYSAKEGNVISTTFSESYVKESLSYYQKNEEKVQEVLQKVKAPKNKWTVDLIAEGCVAFSSSYPYTNICPDTNLDHVIDSFIQRNPDIPFSVLSKISYEKLGRFIANRIISIKNEGSSLDCPHPPPLSPPSHEVSQIHPMLQ